ncbi:protein-glutamate O-methyltransferase CheR [Yoonia sp. SS1-5]|uniref:Chemotaxis protein methyltransferase n=1 Tax=Yoonia rhodophyticola TaxID=3137370 RepID=A0AAN0MF85_9RHOB
MNALNPTLPKANGPSEYAFTDADFRQIAQMANEIYGLFLQDSKKPLVYSRLAKRLRALGLNSFREYCDLFRTTAGRDEQTHLLSALTTNVTHFFRENHHFEQLSTEILPRLIDAARRGEKVRIWSAACSAGQEAYCLAAAVVAACPDAGRFDIKILATDVDPNVLKIAETGRYPVDQLSAIPSEMRRTMVAPTTSDDDFEINPKLRELVTFGELNLVGDWPMKRPFDVIFCRNAAIYFDQTTQARLWERFNTALKPMGYLMIGHSERLSGPATQYFKSIGVTAYQKQQGPGTGRAPYSGEQ